MILLYYVVCGEILLYVDGWFIGIIVEWLQFDWFVLGGFGSDWSMVVLVLVDYKDWMVYWVGLIIDEVEVLYDGVLL